MKLVSIVCLTLNCLLLSAQPKVEKPEIGIVQDFENDSLLHAAGYNYLVESISKCFSPIKVTDQQFQEKLNAMKRLKTSLYAVNIFIPGELKLVGPNVNEASILSYTDVVFQRCQAAGVKLIIWGSAGARRVPEGFDPTKAKEQFIAIAQKAANQAKRYNIMLALENLNSTETNFINTLSEALEIVQKVDHPNFRLCADVYHMLKETEPASVIEKTKKYLVHCDLAEKENRAPPGTSGDDFRPYLKALRKIKYSGKIILECRWNNLATQLPSARLALQKQIDDVYLNK